jgi:hypothetical protein
MRNITLFLFILITASALAKDRTYETGTLVSTSTQADGTYTNNVHSSDGITIAGNVYANTVRVFTIKLGDGTTMRIEPREDATAARERSWGQTHQCTTAILMHGMSIPTTKSAEQLCKGASPLDNLQPGTPIQYRIQLSHRIGGIETDVYVPRLDKPGKEYNYIGPMQHK